MEKFHPSMDWGHELVPSLIWIAKAWGISAVLSLIALFLLARYTVWGRQYWRITGDYFKGRQSVGGLDLDRRAVALDDHLGAPRRLAQLLQQ